MAGILDSKFFHFFLLLVVSGIIFKMLRIFNVEYVYFLSYLLWFISVGIFAIVLPKGRESLF
jgi:hypothetical protein